MSREAMQMALEALESDPISHAGLVSRKQAIAALRKALEEKREPVGYFSVNDYGRWEENEGTYGEPLYTAPPKQWVGLTDEEVKYIADSEWEEAFVRLVEAKLKEKNS